MNLREGMRRLALLLGVAGAILGGFASYIELRKTIRTKAEHNQFALVSSRIEELGKETQKEYPVNNDLNPASLGLRVLGKNPQFWPWLSGNVSQRPELPKPWEVYSARQAQPDPWESAAKQDDWRVWGIKSPDGQTLYPTPAPSVWSYFLIPILPALGFVVPWGAVRAIGWVGAGLVQPSK